MKIPDLLLDVFKKQHSEIESILPLKVEKIIVAYDPTSFEPKEGYVVHVKLLVENCILLSKTKYQKSIPDWRERPPSIPVRPSAIFCFCFFSDF